MQRGMLGVMWACEEAALTKLWPAGSSLPNSLILASFRDKKTKKCPVKDFFLRSNPPQISPLIGSQGRMRRDPGDGLPHPPVLLRLTSPSGFPAIPRHGAGPLGPVAALGVVLAATAAEPALRLADALAAAQPVDHVLGHGIVEPLPVLLGDEDPGKHGGMRGGRVRRLTAGERDLHHRSTSVRAFILEMIDCFQLKC